MFFLSREPFVKIADKKFLGIAHGNWLIFLYFKLSSCPNSVEACQWVCLWWFTSKPTGNQSATVNAENECQTESGSNHFSLAVPAYRFHRNEELELPSLIVDNTRHVTQLSAIKSKIWVLPAKIELFQKPGFWAVSQNLYLWKLPTYW